MDISSLGMASANATVQGAKLNKELEELNSFKADLDKIQSGTNESNELTEKEDAQLKEMCKQFEQYFIKEMYKSMKKTVNYGNIMGYSKGEEVFTEMLEDKYAEKAAESGSLGLAKSLYNQLKVNNSSIKSGE